MEVTEIVSGDMLSGFLTSLTPMLIEIFSYLIPFWFGLQMAKIAMKQVTANLVDREFEAKSRRWEQEYDKFEKAGMSRSDIAGIHRGYWGRQAGKHRRRYGGY